MGLSAGSAFAAGVGVPQLTGAVSNAQTLLDVPFEDMEGNPLTLREVVGEVRMLHYWATWCTPCIAELPEAMQFQQDYKDSGLTIVPISLDAKNVGGVKKFLAANGLKEFETYIDPTTAGYHQIRSMGVPVSVVVDAQGRELSRTEGPVAWGDKELRKKLEGLLPEKK